MRHKLLTVPVVLLTMAGMAYFLLFTKPTYNAVTDYLLVWPPSVPAPADLAAHPSLKAVSPDNIYTRFSDQSVVVDVLASKLTTSGERLALSQQGVNQKYSVTPVIKFGSPTPMVEVIGTGPTPTIAMKSRDVVGTSLLQTLEDIQQQQGVNGYYMIQALEVDQSPPTLQVSGRLRSLIAVGALGAIGLFVEITIADAVDKRRAETRAPRAPRSLGRRHRMVSAE